MHFMYMYFAAGEDTAGTPSMILAFATAIDPPPPMCSQFIHLSVPPFTWELQFVFKTRFKPRSTGIDPSFVHTGGMVVVVNDFILRGFILTMM